MKSDILINRPDIVSDYYNSNGLYAKMFTIPSNKNIFMEFEVTHRNFGNIYRNKYSLNRVLGYATKLIDLSGDLFSGISVLFVGNSNGTLDFFVKGSLPGNAVEIYISKVSNKNHITFHQLSKYNRSEQIVEGETGVSITTPAVNAPVKKSMTFVGTWVNDTFSQFTVKDKICYVSLSTKGGVIDDNTVICNGLPPQYSVDSLGAMYFPALYKDINGVYQSCLVSLQNGGLLTAGVKNNEKIWASFSYPIK